MVGNYIDQLSKMYDDTDGILICDKLGYVEYIKWTDGKYLTASEGVGKHITEIYPELNEETSTIMQTLRTGKARYDERQIIQNYKGHRLDIVTTTLPIYNQNRLLGAMTASIYYEKYKKAKEVPVRPRNKLYELDDIVTENPTMIALKDRCRMIAPNDSPVLLYGETGTGKELFAQSLHTCSHRRNDTFISQNCAAIPDSLLEGIFFGSEKGGFTGAESRKGLFELADGGTLFLDEINSMDVVMQAKLLKVIEEQKVRRLGGTKDIYFNTRIVCAMNQNPSEVLKLGKMREDLFYRISVVRIDIPPLRNRKEDILPLTEYFIRYYNQKMKKQVEGISDLVAMAFANHNWNGNIRELRNTLESAFNLVTGNIINMTDIPLLNLTEAPVTTVNTILQKSQEVPELSESLSLEEAVGQFEKSLILQTLELCGNVSETARKLQLSRQSLVYKLRKYEISQVCQRSW